MEKLGFTIKCIVLMTAFPVIMYVGMTRNEKVNPGREQNKVENPSATNSEETAINDLSFMQAVYN